MSGSKELVGSSRVGSVSHPQQNCFVHCASSSVSSKLGSGFLVLMGFPRFHHKRGKRWSRKADAVS